MGAEILGGLWAFEATISAIAAADFWNPIGWALAIVAVVVIVVIAVVYVVNHWDDIVAFIEWVGGGIASAWNWICETATDVWDSLTGPVTVPVAEPVPEAVPIEIPITIPIAVPIDSTKPAEGGPFNVYDVHVVVPGNYGDYIRGIIDPTSVFLAAGEIYKYGITKYGSVLRRYEAFSWTSPKEMMILENLVSGNFAPYEWYATRRSYAQARFIEAGLITAYLSIRGKLPPGNTGTY